MHYSFFSRIRDILLLCGLFFLAKMAFERISSFIVAHKKSLVHELDRNFMDQIYTAQRQVHFLEEHHLHNDTVALALADIKSRLAAIEELYKTNSPGVMLLGPIGSAAIVAKEEKLQRKLLELANDLNKIVHAINNKDDVFQPAETIDIVLANNKTLLKKLTV